ncbi:MAG: citrate lyase holo-[acyl-carrier protein] synthase [Prevotella sp.]|nr:citrate lyase holo-[acyl-carrier protein] synthase [Prevotella sp.]MDD7273135.1 citrate lyase holo-[acyl-carrier protein] synthase [Prevotellaceae bacterium]MDY3935999.1 citrate lyase holo-[acyl-carrier protein] synthase [Prevotella sp.]MDY4218550.1 citrate lyase holo-[acyl-carrier protein] synthase [Prevotella sp.]
MEVTLDNLLAARDKRQATQLNLIEKYPDYALVCLTVVAPGKVKRNAQTSIIAREAVIALKEVFKNDVKYFMDYDLMTGFEAYFLISISRLKVKEKVCIIEEEHPLGRLFDIDVIDKNGQPISRSAVGRAERKCLICQHEARYCMRNHTHTLSDLQEHIKSLIDSYV